MSVQPAPIDHIASIVLHERVRPWLVEDGGCLSGYLNPSAITFAIGDDGFIQFKPETSRAWMVHIAVVRGGPHVIDAAQQAIHAMRDMGAVKLIATIGSWNKAALRLARQCGFEQEGCLKNAVTKNGQPADLILMGAE